LYFFGNALWHEALAKADFIVSGTNSSAAGLPLAAPLLSALRFSRPGCNQKFWNFHSMRLFIPLMHKRDEVSSN